MQSGTPFDYIKSLPRQNPSERSIERRIDYRRPTSPRDPPTRESHLEARRYWPIHPLLRISEVLPAKLTPIERQKLDKDEWTRRILLKFDQWKPRNA